MLNEESCALRHPDHGLEEELIQWVGSLGYDLDPLTIPRGMHHQWALEDAPNEVQRLVHVGHLPADASFRVLMGVVNPGREALVAWQARWAGRLWRRNRTFRGLLMAVDPQTRQVLVSVLYPDGCPQRPGLHHIIWQPSSADAPCTDRLSRLQILPEDTSAEALTVRLREDLDLKRLTRAFFTTLGQIHERLAACTPGLSVEDGQELAQLTIRRILFLYFVQRKGLLAGQEDFIRRHVRRVMSSGGNLHRRLLKPLFFGVLNVRPERRDEHAQAFGDIPYLNGGLFEPSRLERERPLLELPDEALLEAFDKLFERFAFVTREDGHGLGVDPEVLGRVFESMMASEEREGTGTFYTPRPVVHELVAQGLKLVLERIGLGPQVARALAQGDRSLHIEPAQASKALARLDDVAVLDPACGSGAFLLGILLRLEDVVERLSLATSPPTPFDAVAVRRRLIQRNLHGVDINPAAVRLCELRLWLAILDASPTGAPLEPLPNLDCRIRQGDALLEPIDWTVSAGDIRLLASQIHDLEALKARYGKADSTGRAFLRHHLQEAESSITEALMERRVGQLSAELESLQVAERTTLVEAGARVRARRAWIKLEEQVDHLKVKLKALREGKSVPSFSPLVHFPEVMARGGFDWVVTNPPWVRPHAVGGSVRSLLRRRYKTLSDGAWTAGGVLAHLKGAGSQGDMSVCFVERALELMAPGAVLTALLPSKLLRALYGGGVRRLLMAQAPPVWVREFGEGIFERATTYPVGMVATRTVPQRTSVVTVVDDEGTHTIPVRGLRLDPGDIGSPWWMAQRRAEDPVDALARLGMRVGDHPALQVRRGLMTGLNEAFINRDVSDPAARRRLRPLLKGSGVGAWSYKRSGALLWTHDDENFQPIDEPDEAIIEALAPFEARLRKRHALRKRAQWWRVFRTHADQRGPKVVWRDIGRHLEATAVPGEVEFEGEQRPLLLLNTTYFIPVQTMEQAMALAAWFNSAPVRHFANALAERAAGGYRRFFGWVVALLPLPDAMIDGFGALGWEAALESSESLRALQASSLRMHAGQGTAQDVQRINDAAQALAASSHLRRGLFPVSEVVS